MIHVLSAKRTPINVTLPHCREAGFATVAAFPIAAQQQVLGIFNLFYREARDVAGEERHLLESLGQNLGVAIESLRLVSRERELAIAEERNLLAQELHDSIAQSLAFLNLQTQMLRKALAATDAAETARILDEIQAGVQESYADVRELLVHFRTRIADGDVELGVRTLLTRFQHQTGIATELKATGAAVAARAGRPAAGDAHPAGGAVQRAQALRRLEGRGRAERGAPATASRSATTVAASIRRDRRTTPPTTSACASCASAQRASARGSTCDSRAGRRHRGPPAPAGRPARGGVTSPGAAATGTR